MILQQFYCFWLVILAQLNQLIFISEVGYNFVHISKLAFKKYPKHKPPHAHNQPKQTNKNTPKNNPKKFPKYF